MAHAVHLAAHPKLGVTAGLLSQRGRCVRDEWADIDARAHCRKAEAGPAHRRARLLTQGRRRGRRRSTSRERCHREAARAAGGTQRLPKVAPCQSQQGGANAIAAS